MRGRSDGRGFDGSSFFRRVGNFNGFGFDGGDGGDVFFGDVSGGVVGVFRLFRLFGFFGGFGSFGSFRLFRFVGVFRFFGNGVVFVSRRGRVRVVSRIDGVYGGGDWDGFSYDDGGVSWVVRDFFGVVDDGVDVGGVDGRGG